MFRYEMGIACQNCHTDQKNLMVILAITLIMGIFALILELIDIRKNKK